MRPRLGWATPAGMRTLTLTLVMGGVALLSACQQQGSEPNPGPKEAEQQVGRPGSAPAATAPSGETIPRAFPALEGTIVLGEGLEAESVKPTDVIFVMARTQEGGNLVATEIIENIEFPARFSLDEKDIMVHGEQTHPPYMLSARLDRDQDAMTRGDDDLYALHETPLQGGEKGLKLVLKKKPADALHGGGGMPMDAVHGGAESPSAEDLKSGAGSQPAR